MIINFAHTNYSLRGYALEYVAKCLLRKSKKNNFIFQTCQFDSINEILTKYRLQPIKKLSEQIQLLETDWNRYDLIEFELNNKQERLVCNIILYEVKSTYHKGRKPYFETCLSNHKFMNEWISKGFEAKIVSIILFRDWNFSFNVHKYKDCQIRTYSNHKKIETTN